MKKIILACSWIILMTMSACSDWVNVSPNTDVESEDLFTSESGFKSALIGIYGLTLTEETDLPPDWSAMECTSPVTQTFIEPETEPFEAVTVALPLF